MTTSKKNTNEKSTTGTTAIKENNVITQKITRVKSSVEYHIYADGNIKYKLIDDTGDDKKREASELKNARTKATYFYYDSSNTEHSLGTFDITVTKNTYTDYGDKLGGNKIYLIDMREITSYESTDKKVKFTLGINTTRYYANDVTVASMFGAMLNTSYTDFNFNGGSNEKGESVGGSKSHKNGQNLDLRYLRTDKSGQNVHLNTNTETGDPCGWKGLDVERQNKFHDELKRFGWGKLLSWHYWDAEKSKTKDSKSNVKNSTTTATWNTWYTTWKEDNPTKTDDASKPILKNVTHYDNHHHVHLQSYSPTLNEKTD